MIPPVRELVNVWQVEEAAKAKLAPEIYAEIAGGYRRAFDRITFRPRLMQDVTALDLSVELFGVKHFTPILIGPIAKPERFHPGGEAELRKGAEAGQAKLIGTTGDWIHLESGAPPPAGVNVIVARSMPKFPAKAAVVIKGILNPDDAKRAVAQGAKGIVVSNYGVPEAVHPLDALPAVVDAVAGRVPVLVDGGFRRGTDIAKALAFGASAVLIARPALWGLAAYGAEGVQHVVELLQSELARAVAMIGKVNIKALDRASIRVHRW